MDDVDAGIAEHQPGHAQRREDPRYLFDPEKHTAPPVWAESQRLRQIVEAVVKGTVPDGPMRGALRAALERQLPTLLLWKHASQERPARPRGEGATATLYVIVFPGESTDGTGLKQLNDKVLYYDLNTKFIRERQRIIKEIFGGAPGGTGFITVGQDYKTASIVAVAKTRRAFAAELLRLDVKLRAALRAALTEAEHEAAKETNAAKRKARLREISAVCTAIGKKKWRFDFLFGAATRAASKSTEIEIVYLLLTEALKAAGVARFIAKADAVGRWRGAATGIARRHRAVPDDKNDDDRGKQFDPESFREKTLAATKAIRDVMSQGASVKSAFDYMNIYVNGVWTVPWVIYHPDEQRLVANPDVIRDARKRALTSPPMKAGVKGSFRAQVQLLELWLVAINTIDLIKDFVVPEFKNELVWYHRRAEEVYAELEGTGRVNGAQLEKVLTRDLRQGPDPLPVLGRASEFQFYAHASDYANRIFFVMDVRDLGVDLMIPYELSSDEMLGRRLGGERLMAETFWSSDPINRRKRATYEAVVDEFRKAHWRATRDAGWRRHVLRAFGVGGGGVEPMPSFERSLEVMMGGDEFFVAAHAAYAGHEAEIIAGLDQRLHYGLPLNLRSAVAYSSATWAKRAPTAPPSPDQRARNADAHSEALALASSAPNTLKEFERTHRRIERLIEKVPRDPRRQPKADPKRDKNREEKAKKYREELGKLGLLELYARAKHSEPGLMKPGPLRLLLAALAAGDPRKAAAVSEGKFDLVDFRGEAVDERKLSQAALALENRVERDARRNNVHIDPPPIMQKPKLPKWLKEILPDRAYKLIQEWYDDNGRKEWEWKRQPRPDPASRVT